MDLERTVRSLAAGQGNGDQRHFCPACYGERKNKHDKPLSVKVEDNHILYRCWHCTFAGKIPLLDAPADITYPKLAVPKYGDATPAYNYLASRGITRRTAEEAGVIYDPNHFVGGKNTRAIGFPYDDQDVPAIKWRSIDDKSFIQTGAARTFWQIGRIKPGDMLVICEGEIDCLSLWQAGVPAVSVPNGAPSKLTDEKKSSPLEDKKYAYLSLAKTTVDDATRVVVATDSDIQGQALGEEIARRVGRDRCWRVNWPEDCKDANDTLRTHGPAVVRECVEKAEPWPVKGLYGVNHFAEAVASLYKSGLARGESTGFKVVDEVYTIMPGQLTVVTGIPSMGKSAFVDQLMVNLAKVKGWRFAICSFENEPRIHIAKLMQLYSGKPFFDGPTPRLTEAETPDILAKINEHFCFLYQGDGHQSSIEDILDRLKSAVLRYGIRGAVIDPYNFIDRNRDMSETDWVSDMLTKLKIFLMAHDLHVWMVAHPAKQPRGEDGLYRVPDGYSISGSAHWFNKADMGISVHRPDLAVPESEIHVWKSRYSWIGKPGKATLEYDVVTGEYYEKRWTPQPVYRRPLDEALN